MPADFYNTVRALRRVGQDRAIMALFAAMVWSDEKLDAAEQAGDMPGNPATLPPARGAYQ
jgi:hypothetical protein